MREASAVASLIFLLMSGCSEATTVLDVDSGLLDGQADAALQGLGAVEITRVVTLIRDCRAPRIQVIYVIPGRLELGESTNVEVRAHNLVGQARVTFAIDDGTSDSAEIELTAARRCAAGSIACQELTCVGLDGGAVVEHEGPLAGSARVAVTVEDDDCRDTEYVSVECVEHAQDSSRCGNGVLEPGEQCDGEAGLQDSIVQQCGADCMVLATCGNGIVEGAEACDDGNDVARDGCGSDCTLSPEPYCGDGLLDDGEACDGSAGLLDGDVQVCNADCTIAPICGNGYAEPPEACDDGNDVEGDGCQADCTQTPIPVCGNGLLEGNEACDDGNAVDGDGCDSDCRTEQPRGFCERHPRARRCRSVDRFRDRSSAQPQMADQAPHPIQEGARSDPVM